MRTGTDPGAMMCGDFFVVFGSVVRSLGASVRAGDRIWQGQVTMVEVLQVSANGFFALGH